MHHPTDRITHTTDFVTPVVDHWLEREIAKRNINTSNSCDQRCWKMLLLFWGRQLLIMMSSLNILKSTASQLGRQTDRQTDREIDI